MVFRGFFYRIFFLLLLHRCLFLFIIGDGRRGIARDGGGEGGRAWAAPVQGVAAVVK